MRLKRLCHCGKEVVGQCECAREKKARAADYRYCKTGQRYPTGWTELSRQYRLDNPLCEVCLSEGRTEPTTEVHHVEKVRDRFDLALCRDNLVAVCRACHERIETA
jgi:5-methylcytosine-specific restriction protein A